MKMAQWSHSVYIMKVEPIGFTDGLNMGYEKKSGMYGEGKHFSPSITRVLCGIPFIMADPLLTYLPHQARETFSPRTFTFGLIT